MDFNEVIAQSKRAWITRPSNTLIKSEAELINIDLENNVIDIVAIESYSLQDKNNNISRRKRKRINNNATGERLVIPDQSGSASGHTGSDED